MSQPRNPRAEARKPLCRLVLEQVAFANDAGYDATTSKLVRLLRFEGHRHEHSTIAKRLSELHAAGWVRPVGSEVSPLTNRPQTAWQITASGRRELERVARQASRRVA